MINYWDWVKKVLSAPQSTTAPTTIAAQHNSLSLSHFIWLFFFFFPFLYPMWVCAHFFWWLNIIIHVKWKHAHRKIILCSPTFLIVYACGIPLCRILFIFFSFFRSLPMFCMLHLLTLHAVEFSKIFLFFLQITR